MENIYEAKVMVIGREHVDCDVIIDKDTIERRSFCKFLFSHIENLKKGRKVSIETSVKPGTMLIRITAMTSTKKEKRDFLGRKLNIDDQIVFMQVGYRGLMEGTIISMSEKKAKIKHKETNTGKTETTQFFKQLVKI